MLKKQISSNSHYYRYLRFSTERIFILQRDVVYMIFRDRGEAGEKLADRLEKQGMKADLVLAIPRGGLPLGRKVADKLECDLDVIVASKIGAPENPELGIGAAASDGSYWLNEDLVTRLGVGKEYIEAEIQDKSEKARRKLVFMRGKQDLPELEGKRIVVVDDGIATGGTLIACLRQIRNSSAETITVAVPVAPEDIPDKLEDVADEIIILEKPPFFGSVGMHYKDFKQVTDEEAREYLD